MQMIAIIALGAISAVVVNAVLRQLIAKPIRKLCECDPECGQGKLECRRTNAKL